MMPKMLYVGLKEEIKGKELLLDLCLPDHPQIKFVAIVITFRNRKLQPPRNPGYSNSGLLTIEEINLIPIP